MLTQRVLELYEAPNGVAPFGVWINTLKDRTTANRINSRLNRLRAGNLGIYRPVGEGVCELKLDFGPGYRVYFGQHRERIIVLLCGGDKSTQEQDIHLAKDYWSDYRRQNHEGK